MRNDLISESEKYSFQTGMMCLGSPERNIEGGSLLKQFEFCLFIFFKRYCRKPYKCEDICMLYELAMYEASYCTIKTEEKYSLVQYIERYLWFRIVYIPPYAISVIEVFSRFCLKLVLKSLP
jgi:hypothetical protein